MQYFIISFSLCFACSVIFFLFIVWVVGFHEALPCPRFVLGHLLLCMGVHVLMHLDVARNTQQLAVGGIVTPCTHSVWAFDRLGLLDGSDVMHVHTSGDEAIGLAQLAQATGTSEHLSPQQLPLLVV